MSGKVKKYESEKITVLWQAEKCIHSESCFKGLSEVFNPNKRPWINVKGADDDQIKEQIDKCPSGALSYELKSQESNERVVQKEQKLEVVKNGPLIVHGAIKVKHHDGTEISKNRATAFCRCGASSNKPFCDGSHKKIEFKG